MGKAKWWVCDDCKSLNDLPANKCYGCRVAKPAAPSLIDDQYGEVRGGPQKRVGISVDMALVPGLVARDPLEHYKGGDIIEAFGVDDDEPLASSQDSLEPATPPPPMRAPSLRSIAEIGGEHWDPPSVSPGPSPTADPEPEAVPGAAATPSVHATPSAPTASAPPPSPPAASSAPPPIPGQAPPPGYMPPPGAPQGGPQVRPASPLPPPPGVRPPPPLGVAPPPPIGYRSPLPYPPPPMPPGAQRLPPPPLPPGRQAPPPPPPPMAQRSPAGAPSTPPAAPDPTDSSDE